MNVLELLKAETGIHAKHVSTTKGGEYHSPCPGCGGDDRFHVWPEQNNGRGSYWCRGCGKTGDDIQYLMDFQGLGFQDACIRLDRDIPSYTDIRAPKEIKKRPTWTPHTNQDPGQTWLERAKAFAEWANKHLQKNKNQIDYLATRGITPDTIARHQLGWNPENYYRPRSAWALADITKENGKKKKLWIPQGLVIPTHAPASSGDRVIRLRIRRPEGQPRYYAIPGSNMAPMIIGPQKKALVIVESELDAILTAQDAGELVGVIAMGSSSAKPDHTANRIITAAKAILVALDFDTAGAHAWQWWKETFTHAIRWPVPIGKDPGDAYKLGLNIAQWIRAGLPPIWTIKPDRHLGQITKEGRGDAPPPPEPPHPREKIHIFKGLKKLSQLMKNSPVHIINTTKSTRIERDEQWSALNREKSGRISELVFQDPGVFAYILKHPASRIDGENLLDGINP
ncbi:MAG: helicase [Desulfobacteraceae bacterium]|nr:helicase [Desulfobacteraceae bacterium]